jgi:hypothetical protein
VVGFLLWPVGLIGAIRLAEPDSLLARHLYDADKRRRARERYPDLAGPDEEDGPDVTMPSPGGASARRQPGSSISRR